ncbi:hypothetical protein ABZ404_36790 [Streptomyces sp. NPDC005878]|uniref:hypothetical protein n=1 Tax=Streptomyces sp. NPDC005878 TaxID=3157077 RepID=UPI0033FC03FD
MTTPVRTPQAGLEHRTEILALIVAAAGRLTAAWHRLTAAQDVLLRRLERLRASRDNVGSLAALRLALNDFNRAVGDFDREARVFAERWAATDLPAAYRDGALRALRSINRPPAMFTWTSPHQMAITGLSAQYYADLVGRMNEAVRRAQAFARAARDQARTPQGVRAADLLAAHPLDTVVYANQARHPVQGWARAATAAQIVSTANRGAINVARYELGAQWMEVVDGPECGWVSHPDGDLAHGSIRAVEECEIYPIAHPGCIRQFIPRPDLTGRLVDGGL